MELGWIAFRQIVIMILLMGVGVISAKTNLIDEVTSNKISSLLLFLVTPLVVFTSFQRNLEPHLAMGLLGALGLSVVLFALSFGVTYVIHRKKPDNPRYPIEASACIYPNAGFIGIPLIGGIFGAEGVIYVTVYIVVFNLVNWTHGVAIMSGKSLNLVFLKKALMSPAIVAITLGLGLFLLDIQLPELVLEPLTMLGSMNTPLAMLVSGVALSRTNLLNILKEPLMYKVVGTRLLLMPLAFIGLVQLVGIWWELPLVLASTFVIIAGCPIGVKVVLFAYKYEKDHVYATELMVASIVFSMLTIPLLLFLI